MKDHTSSTQKISRPGGLRGRKQKPKVVMQHANDENPQRCFLRIYKIIVQQFVPQGLPCRHIVPPSTCQTNTYLLGTPTDHMAIIDLLALWHDCVGKQVCQDTKPIIPYESPMLHGCMI